MYNGGEEELFVSCWYAFPTRKRFVSVILSIRLFNVRGEEEEMWHNMLFDLKSCSFRSSMIYLDYICWLFFLLLLSVFLLFFRLLSKIKTNHWQNSIMINRFLNRVSFENRWMISHWFVFEKKSRRKLLQERMDRRRREREKLIFDFSYDHEKRP